MTSSPTVVDVYVQPGECRFGDRNVRLLTLLGSCVAATFWHPERLIGGMCHFMLPNRGKNSEELDGRYGDEAFELMRQWAQREGTDLKEYQVKLFGGGQMFDSFAPGGDHVGTKNIEAARRLVLFHGLKLMAEDLGGAGHRNVRFDIWSGDVWMRQVPYQRATPS